MFCFALALYSDIGISLFSFRFGLKAALVALAAGDKRRIRNVLAFVLAFRYYYCYCYCVNE